ncbi:hypothetical protein ACFVZ2_10635, partial [Streptomyces lasiicapitis]
RGALFGWGRAPRAVYLVLGAGLRGAPTAGPVRAAHTLLPPRLEAATLKDTVIRRGPPAPADLALAA